MTIKNILRIVTLSVLGIYFSHCVYYFLTNEARPKYKDCGIVVSKSSDEVIIKRGSRTELYLNIQFEKSKFRSVNVEPTTYFSNNVGDYVCFYLDKELSILHNIQIIIGATVLLLLVIIGVAWFIIYLVTD